MEKWHVQNRPRKVMAAQTVKAIKNTLVRAILLPLDHAIESTKKERNANGGISVRATCQIELNCVVGLGMQRRNVALRITATANAFNHQKTRLASRGFSGGEQGTSGG
jgi:hypothetical protein